MGFIHRIITGVENQFLLLLSDTNWWIYYNLNRNLFGWKKSDLKNRWKFRAYRNWFCFKLNLNLNLINVKTNFEFNLKWNRKRKEYFCNNYIASCFHTFLYFILRFIGCFFLCLDYKTLIGNIMFQSYTVFILFNKFIKKYIYWNKLFAFKISY